ncbi:MAG: hypothetical protein A2416_01185 [Candidatus Staskawiczbacteria bacterium RIFOXYC1_FULL_37_52]|nr:MAG: hypothetical protein A2416_01185 [Candidatus Staskawiczbacteria bacterium RIFOXYC1_FULL_37_52]OGZ88674.1 MAG: hypothetical protein A2444_02405 [Candidatus Staskawiczbacteria bacterium RIFOXYC2_FULL_37_19]
MALFMPFVSGAQEITLGQASLSISVNIDNGKSELFHFDLQGFDVNGILCGSTSMDVWSNSFFQYSFNIPDPICPIYLITERKIPGAQFTGAFCSNSASADFFGYSSNSAAFFVEPGANIECSFQNTAVKVPVLIIPGLLGTEMKKGDELLWADIDRMTNPFNSDNFMDPLAFNNDLTPGDTSVNNTNVIKKLETALGLVSFDYTDGLVDEFKSHGYLENESLFLFPYDWRYGASGKYADGLTNVDLLNQKIQDIINQTGEFKIDVVAHSLGGLIFKKYVIDYPVGYSDSAIRKAVMLGVPNLGAPKAIKVLLQGDNFGVLGLSDFEMKKIAKNMPAAYDLLPDQQYFDEKGSFIKIINEDVVQSTHEEKDLSYHESKDFLISGNNLNAAAENGAENLHTLSFDKYDLRWAGIDLYSINGCKTRTLGGITQENFKNVFGQTLVSYSALKSIRGDGTVPLESAGSLPIDENNKYYALVADHGKMPSQDGIKQQIANILDQDYYHDINADLVTKDISQCQLNGKAISIFSPVNIFVTDQNENKLGLADDGSVINEIPNADFEIWGEHKFLYLPTDNSQTYTINLTGTGNGTFTIKSENIINNEVAEAEVFSDVPVTPELTGQINLAGHDTSLVVQQNTTSQPETILPDGLQPEEPPPPPPPDPGPATLVAFEPNGLIENEVTFNATTNDANLNTAVLSRGSGISPWALANSFSSKFFTPGGTKADAISNDDYYQVVISAKTNYKVSLSSIDVNIRRSSAGPDEYQWQYSLDNFATPGIDVGAQGSVVSSDNGLAMPQIDLSGVTNLQNVASGTTITFRLYAFGALGSGGTFAIGRLVGDDLVFRGSVNLITHTLTYTAGVNGSITGSTPQTVDHGSSGSEVIAVPNANYHFTSWSDGSTTNLRTDTNITADISVAAGFEADVVAPPPPPPDPEPEPEPEISHPMPRAPASSSGGGGGGFYIPPVVKPLPAQIAPLPKPVAVQTVTLPSAPRRVAISKQTVKTEIPDIQPVVAENKTVSLKNIKAAGPAALSEKSGFLDYFKNMLNKIISLFLKKW